MDQNDGLDFDSDSNPGWQLLTELLIIYDRILLTLIPYSPRKTTVLA
jgi:hypothetical protein